MALSIKSEVKHYRSIKTHNPSPDQSDTLFRDEESRIQKFDRLTYFPGLNESLELLDELIEQMAQVPEELIDYVIESWPTLHDPGDTQAEKLIKNIEKKYGFWNNQFTDKGFVAWVHKNIINNKCLVN